MSSSIDKSWLISYNRLASLILACSTDSRNTGLISICAFVESVVSIVVSAEVSYPSVVDCEISLAL